MLFLDFIPYFTNPRATIYLEFTYILFGSFKIGNNRRVLIVQNCNPALGIVAKRAEIFFRVPRAEIFFRVAKRAEIFFRVPKSRNTISTAI